MIHLDIDITSTFFAQVERYIVIMYYRASTLDGVNDARLLYVMILGYVDISETMYLPSPFGSSHFVKYLYTTCKTSYIPKNIQFGAFFLSKNKSVIHPLFRESLFKI